MQKGIIRRLNKELPKELYDMETYFISPETIPEQWRTTQLPESAELCA